MTLTSRIVATEIAWPIEIVAGQNNLVVDMTVSSVSTIYNVALTPGTYWSHKFFVGMPGCFMTHIGQRIQAVTGQLTSVQRGIQLLSNGTSTGPSWRFTHANPAVTASSIAIFDPSTTVPLDLLGWHYNDANAGQWSEHIPGGSFATIDSDYSTVFSRSRVVEWRPKGNTRMELSSNSPNAIRSVSDVHRTVEFEASGVAGPFINDELMTHTPSLLAAFGNVDIAESRGSSLNNLWAQDPDNLRFYVQLDNASSKRHWWAPCRIEGDIIGNLATWRSDEPGYPGEHHRVRLPLRLTSDMVRLI